jgi:hypothetical protein
MTYQCHNRAPFAETVQVQNGWTIDGRRQLVSAAYTMNRDCEYSRSDLGQSDKGCIGCKWKREEA